MYLLALHDIRIFRNVGSGTRLATKLSHRPKIPHSSVSKSSSLLRFEVDSGAARYLQSLYRNAIWLSHWERYRVAASGCVVASEATSIRDLHFATLRLSS